MNPLHLHGLNVDGVSVILGTHGRAVNLLKNESPWLTATNFFNHRVELAAKYAFKNSFFENINEILVFLYYLYQRSSKKLHALSWEKSIY